MGLQYEIYNPTIVTLSITILILLCIALIAMVYALSNALWRKQNKGKDNIASKEQRHYLTGLPNRFSLLQTLDPILTRGKKEGTNVALLFVDIDDFNNINVSLGNATANALLLHISQTIVATVREYSDLIYHIGSDEFAIILNDFGNDTNILAQVANDIIHAVAHPASIDGYELHSSCCIGICTYPECSSDADSLLKNAGSARDNAKKIGYSSHSFYTKEMSRKSVMRTLISRDVRNALERNEFYIHYQPKIDVASGNVQGAEALLRWHHPSLGNITPDIFIPAIEDLGLIHPIGGWIIKTACKDLKKIHNAGFTDLHMAINISAHQFNKGDIATIVAEAIWEAGIAPEKVELELTEAVVMSDTEKSLLMFKVLQSMGVKIAVDDFGTGYSAMNRLTKFPISILKIDKYFIHDLHLNSANMAIVSTIIRMGKQLGYQVVAEGVERQEEVDLLRKEGCDLIQGFYYSKPLALTDFIQYAQDTNPITATAAILGISEGSRGQSA